MNQIWYGTLLCHCHYFSVVKCKQLPKEIHGPRHDYSRKKVPDELSLTVRGLSRKDTLGVRNGRGRPKRNRRTDGMTRNDCPLKVKMCNTMRQNLLSPSRPSGNMSTPVNREPSKPQSPSPKTSLGRSQDCTAPYG